MVLRDIIKSSIPVRVTKKKNHTIRCGFSFCRTGIERPSRKVSGGHFLGRGRFHLLPVAALVAVNGSKSQTPTDAYP